MQPHVLTIRKRDVTKWLAKLLETRDVIAPARGPCGEIVFSEVHAPEEVVWDFENPLPPPKQFLLPQTDPIVRIQVNGQGARVEPIHDGKRRVLFNVRPCDAKGIAFLTRMHEMEPADASYMRRAENLTVISLACTAPCRLGFCVCSDSGPFLNSSHDIQLTDLGQKYLAEIGSPKGARAVAEVASLFDPATADEVRQRKELEAEARGRFGEETCHFASAMRRVSTRRVADALWDRISDWCLECGACNFICPTCYCFSVKDRGGDGAWTRCRTWDSCQYAAFTLEASGHNPRAQHGERVKRRFFHKVSAQYYVRDGMTGCVGCGRCVKVCLGTTDMPAVVAAIRKGAWHGQ
jgi:formate hydrogenlyase subunit 6/NADH:ubiquinone oxidoreductase subunit I